MAASNEDLATPRSPALSNPNSYCISPEEGGSLYHSMGFGVRSSEEVMRPHPAFSHNEVAIQPYNVDTKTCAPIVGVALLGDNVTEKVREVGMSVAREYDLSLIHIAKKS
jgi:hypothetical protein